MNTTGNSTKKANGHGAARQACGSDELDSVSAGDAIPRAQLIAEAAFFRAERRGSAPGNELSDWLDAEAELDILVGNSVDRPDTP